MTWDALVIGAGPAGSVTARELARQGCRVLLVDKSTFPRPKVCGCCLNGAAIRTLNQLGLGRVLEAAIPLGRVRIGAGFRCAELNLPRGLALSREALDARLVEEAVNAGVAFRPGVSVNHESELCSSAHIVIHACGLAGQGRPEAGSRLGAGVVLPAEVAPEFYCPQIIHMATGRGGYVGLVRLEDGRLDVAAAFDSGFVKSSGGLGPSAVALLHGVGWPMPAGLAEAHWRGTPALTRRPQRRAERGVFRVGDAAGYVEPFTGEGIAWAIMSAAALAPIAARAAKGWDDSLAREWEFVHRRLIAPRQRICRWIAWGLRSPAITGLAIRALQIFPRLSRPMVAGLNRGAPHGIRA